MFKFIRIIFLLIVLLSVWSTLQLQKNVTRDWQVSADVIIIPVIADDSANTLSYVEQLSLRDFKGIERYAAQQITRYRSDLNKPVQISLAPPIESHAPRIPELGASRLSIIIWSLRLRWWAWKNKPIGFRDSQIRLYVLYSSPNEHQRLPHSTGLQNGLIGLIHARAYSEQRRINNVILMHELMHVLGASDKYDLVSGSPDYPEGFANPDQQPVYPQELAELMARVIPLSENKFELARSLGRTRIGQRTAKEIGWLNEP